MNDVKKYAYIDALRGIAATGIILHHTPRSYLNDQVNSFLILGAGGVPLFFILSAFTLFMSFERRSSNEINPVRNFFIRRFFRIAPLFYLLILYFLLQDGFTARYNADPSSEINVWTLISTFTFTFGMHPYWINAIVPSSWSIGTEVIFYAVLPFIFFLVSDLQKALWFLIFALGSSKIVCFTVAHFLPQYLSDTVTHSPYWDAFIYMYFPAQFPVFALGILLYFILKPQGNAFKELSTPILILCVFLFLNNGAQKFSTDGLIPKFITDSALLFLPFIFALHIYPSKLFVNKTTIFLGKISYSMYLTHAIVIHFVDTYVPAYLLGTGILNYSFHFIMILLLTVLLATSTYYLIEKTGITLGQRLIERMEGLPNKMN
jgi:peptidoglycan/LPS O-acetylase OafA/YrhL